MSLRLSSVHRSTSRAPQQARARRRRRLWALEGLEGRVLLSGNHPTNYTVTDTSDSVTDTGSLPCAITEANANTNSAGSVIEFDPRLRHGADDHAVQHARAERIGRAGGDRRPRRGSRDQRRQRRRRCSRSMAA